VKNRQRILDAACGHFNHEDKNVRQAVITLVLNYSVNFLATEDLEGRIQAVSAMSQAFEQEKDLQNLLRMTTTLGNLCFNNEEVFEFVGGLGITFPDVNKL